MLTFISGFYKNPDLLIIIYHQKIVTPLESTLEKFGKYLEKFGKQT